MNCKPRTIGTMKSIDINLTEEEVDKLILDLTIGNLQSFEVQEFLTTLKSGLKHFE